MIDADKFELRKPLLHMYRRKLWIGLSVLAVCSIVVLFSEAISELVGMESWILSLIGVALFAFVLFFVAHGIKCPSCKVNLFWYGLANAKHANWFDWMLNQVECPKCRYRNS
jgi:hypothetical protein